jgi:hypothetical protein
MITENGYVRVCARIVQSRHSNLFKNHVFLDGILKCQKSDQRHGTAGCPWLSLGRKDSVPSLMPRPRLALVGRLLFVVLGRRCPRRPSPYLEEESVLSLFLRSRPAKERKERRIMSVDFSVANTGRGEGALQVS